MTRGVVVRTVGHKLARESLVNAFFGTILAETYLLLSVFPHTTDIHRDRFADRHHRDGNSFRRRRTSFWLPGVFP